MRSVKIPACIVIILLFAISCGKIEKLSPVPSISFNNFEVFDSTDILGNTQRAGRLNFHFQDGDGDLGGPVPGLSTPQDTVNLFFTLLKKRGGIFTTGADNDPLNPGSFTIPYMDRQGQNKILRGNISVTILYLFYSNSNHDTIMYRFFVKDRAQHSSDTVSTCEIVLSKNGSCNR